jgi:hypothetical protein
MLMPDQIDPGVIAYCGVNCLACSAHLGGKHPCPGCRESVEQITRKSCRDCQIKSCATGRGHDGCWQCDDFPCARIKRLDQRYRRNYNLDLIQAGMDARHDMDSFLQAQQARFTCASCGGVIDQHHQHCSECDTAS